MAIDPSTLGDGLVVGVLGNVLYAAGVFGLKRYREQLEHSAPKARQALWLLAFGAYLVGNGLLSRLLPGVFLWSFVASSVILSSGIWLELRQFWRLGLVGADRTISGGTDFKRSLRLCRNSLAFLGIGARKLITSSRSDFDQAIRRCQRSDQPVRFLLSSPDSPKLEEMARRAGRDRAEYQGAVRESLAVLADLKVNTALNIEVRVYDELPLFRLMFIDDTLCLASHYVFSEGDGSQLPQLHLRKRVGQGRDVESLYYPFKLYFDGLWQRARPFQLETPLRGAP